MRSAIIAILRTAGRMVARARNAINSSDPIGAANARVAGMLSVDLSGR